MSEPQTPVPAQIYEDARAVSSCSRYPASMLGGTAFAGMLNSWDPQATHKQELLVAYVMGLAKLLEAKGVFTQNEFIESVEGWLADRKEWAQDLANETVGIWNEENPGSVQPQIDAEDLGFRNVEPAAQHPFWPWQYPSAVPPA